MSSPNEQALLYQAFIQKTYKSKIGRYNNKGAVTLMRSLLLMESAGYLTQGLRNKNITFIKKQINAAFDHILIEKEINSVDTLKVLELKKTLEIAQSGTSLVEVVEQALQLLDNKK